MATIAHVARGTVRIRISRRIRRGDDDHDRDNQRRGDCGSLRKASINRGLVRAAAEADVPGIQVEPLDLIDIPLYNGDVEDAGTRMPEPAGRLAWVRRLAKIDD